MSSELLDLLDDAAEATKPSIDGLGRASALAQRFEALEIEATALLAKAKEVSDQMAVIAERDIPALFDELKIRDLTLDNGRTLSIKNTYIGKIPEERREEAYTWLEDHAMGALVKTKVEAQFGMGELAKAKALQEQLIEQGFVVNADRSVHPATLGKFVKTMLLAGNEIPKELFQPNVLRRAQLK
jgi:hypothetical protein